MAERTIVDIGKALQKYGLNVGENSAFGGVGKGHSSTGYHPKDMAIDVRDWRPDMAPAYSGGKPKSWKQRTGELSWRAKQLGLFNEALGPGDKGHDTHVHLALEGKKPITEEQLQWLGTGRSTQGGQLTDVMPGGALPAPTQPAMAPAQTTISPNARTEDILKAFMYGAGSLGKKEEPQKTFEQQLKEQLLGTVLKEALTPTSFLSSYATSNPFLTGQSAATGDFLSGVFS
jgi:hypothetical protein